MPKRVMIIPPIIICEKAPQTSLSGVQFVELEADCPYCGKPLKDHKQVNPSPQTTGV